MKTVGIIAEYNPFHNGHLYQLTEARRITGADMVVVVMSGNFVQRGTPAVFHKSLRAQAALISGADAVFELPVSFSCSSAELFAEGSIALLKALGVDFICFGSECGDIVQIQKLADFLYEESAEYKKVLSGFLREGYSFPAAREQACLSCLHAKDEEFAALIPSLMQNPNNLLGVEYCKAIKRLKSEMKAVTIKRLGSSHHSTGISFDTDTCLSSPKYVSASAIRSLIEDSAFPLDKKLEQIKSLVPDSVFELYHKDWTVSGSSCPFITTNDFTELLSYRLLFDTVQQLSLYQDWNLELVNRLYSIDFINTDFDELAFRFKSKQITLTRAYRMLLHALLQLPAQTILNARAEGSVFYARLLGFRDSSSYGLKHLQDISKVPIISRLAPAVRSLSGIAKELLLQDIRTSELYRLVLQNKRKQVCPNEYQSGVIRIQNNLTE